MEIEKRVRKQAAKSKDTGAVVTFTGIVRSEGGRLWGLEYEKYGLMAATEIRKLEKAAVEKFKIFDVEIVQKTGRCPAGEPVFLVTVSARHRREAFQACEWVVDEFKQRVPVWKTEIGARKD